ncbi:small GTP-binding protein [Thermogladius calderae 1633]|uniref:Ferrous iron transport protein B n=1 Tax=Thermogladius calderae (strain DSM 22663 / VKM B-2946 / 1633) TaxID=1184251 RepID=I3TER4_THEC1|nr:small GTP-binding protein [Thermogladius calderae 1633]
MVANWPGVTVEKHEGSLEHRGYRIKLVDLPGVYGLSALTLEERISRSYILGGEADVIIALVDTTIPERTLYLPIQILEAYKNVVIAYTKYDMAHEMGIHINFDTLEKRLGVPVVPVSAATGYGIEYLLDKVIEVAEKGGRRDYLRIDYGELEPFIESVERELKKCEGLREYPSRWLAIRLLEGDEELAEMLSSKCGSEVYRAFEEARDEARKVVGKDVSMFASAKRFSFIMSLTREAVVRARTPERKARSIFYHPAIGTALSLTLLLSIFMLVFIVNTGFPLNVVLSLLGQENLAAVVEEYSLSGMLGKGLGWLMDIARSSIANPLLASFVADGVIGGVASILTFLPLIFVVMFVLSVVEDAGLLPRMAVGVSALTTKIGLSGNALFPITVSLGCNVPGIMGARASLTAGERIRQILTLPLIPCQARLVVLLALATALKTLGGWVMVFTGYVAAFSAFIVLNYALYRLSRKREPIPEMLLEIPAYHKPLGKVVWWMTWNNVKHFLEKAGTIIFVSSVAVWAMSSFTPALTYTDNPSNSIAAEVSRLLIPAVYPFHVAGENAWMVVFGLLMGFVAKEVFVTSILTITGTPSMAEAVSVMGLTDAQLIAIGVFTTLYVPCLATLSTIYSETRSVKLTALAVLLLMGTAYLVSALLYYFLTLLV